MIHRVTAVGIHMYIHICRYKINLNQIEFEFTFSKIRLDTIHVNRS